jgi:hypothetical protein
MRRLPLAATLAALVFLDVSALSGITGNQVLHIQPLGKELPNEDLAFYAFHFLHRTYRLSDS